MGDTLDKDKESLHDALRSSLSQFFDEHDKFRFPNSLPSLSIALKRYKATIDSPSSEFSALDVWVRGIALRSAIHRSEEDFLVSRNEHLRAALEHALFIHDLYLNSFAEFRDIKHNQQAQLPFGEQGPTFGTTVSRDEGLNEIKEEILARHDILENLSRDIRDEIETLQIKLDHSEERKLSLHQSFKWFAKIAIFVGFASLASDLGVLVPIKESIAHLLGIR